MCKVLLQEGRCPIESPTVSTIQTQTLKEMLDHYDQYSSKYPETNILEVIRPPGSGDLTL